MSAERDRERLETILKLVRLVQERVGVMTLEAFEQDVTERDLSSYRLAIIGENGNKLSEGLKARHPEVAWRDIYAFRNVAVHAYESILPLYVWTAIQDLEPIKAMCLAELAALPDRP